MSDETITVNNRHNHTISSTIIADKFGKRHVEVLTAREQLIYNVTEDFLVILEDRNISKKELANRLGKSQSYVTQLLSGLRNMTLGSLSDICFALDFEPKIQLPVSKE